MKNKSSSGCGCLLGLVFFCFFLALIFVLPMMKGRGFSKSSGNTREEFIQSYAPLAREIGHKYGLYPSMVLGQAALESNFGNSDLSKEANNYFGIKAKKGKGVAFQTREVEGGRGVYLEENFAKYPSPRASFKAYGKLMGEAPRYERVRRAKSLDEALSLLHPTGYSTDPNYGKMVKKIIDQYNLEQYDAP